MINYMNITQLVGFKLCFNIFTKKKGKVNGVHIPTHNT